MAHLNLWLPSSCFPLMAALVGNHLKIIKSGFLLAALAALAALSAHVKNLGCTSLTSTHGMCHESLITLGVTSTCKLLVPPCSKSHKVLYILD